MVGHDGDSSSLHEQRGSDIQKKKRDQGERIYVQKDNCMPYIKALAQENQRYGNKRMQRSSCFIQQIRSYPPPRNRGINHVEIVVKGKRITRKN